MVCQQNNDNILLYVHIYGISKLSNFKVKWNGEGHLKVEVVVWGARTGQGRRPDGKWTSPTIEVRGRELLRLSALRTQPNRNRRSAAAASCHETIAGCSPYGLPSPHDSPSIAYHRSHCQRSECIV